MELSRVRRSREAAGSSYDRISRIYDFLSYRSEWRHAEQGLQLLNAQNGEKVLEIGFGTGRALVALARAVGSSGRVFGIDLSAGMCRIAGSRLEKAGLEGRAELMTGDAIQLSFDNNVFDAVFTSFTLELFDTPEIPIVLHECRRVLKTGGRICVVSLSRTGNPSLMLRLYEWSHRAFPGLIDCRPIFVRTAIEEAGLRVLDFIRKMMWGLPIEIVMAEKPEARLVEPSVPFGQTRTET